MTKVDDQQEVIAFLSCPQTYGVAGPVERIDTHAAILFLAGERVYKLKRAVRYSYLDFSSVEKRKAVCEAELKLNRRTAPELYLELRSVNRGADGGMGFGDGEPVDWLVVMRRFEAADLLEAVAARGAFGAGLARSLADHIAAFHESAEIRQGPDGAERVRKVIDGNRASMDALPAGSLPPGDCAALHARSLAELERLADLLDRRAAQGRVRHCHGDLHLANICLWQGRPLLFDCLEFDSELATTDVLYDLAFLIMDLWEKGYRAQASLVFNRYLDMCDESDGVAALPLFLSMRAAVRAHVGAIVAGLRDGMDARAAGMQAARGYLAAALGFLEPARPRLIAIGGLSGSGKSTLAGMLAPGLGAAPGARWLRTDVLRKRLAGIAPEEPLPPQAYTRERSAEVYQRLMAQARAMLEAGRSVIVDGVFADPGERAEIAAVAQAVGAGFTGLWLEAPQATLIDRVTARTGDASDADRRVVERQLTYDLGDLADWRRVDAGGTPEDVLGRVLRLAG